MKKTVRWWWWEKEMTILCCYFSWSCHFTWQPNKTGEKNRRLSTLNSIFFPHYFVWFQFQNFWKKQNKIKFLGLKKNRYICVCVCFVQPLFISRSCLKVVVAVAVALESDHHASIGVFFLSLSDKSIFRKKQKKIFQDPLFFRCNFLFVNPVILLFILCRRRRLRQIWKWWWRWRENEIYIIVIIIFSSGRNIKSTEKNIQTFHMTTTTTSDEAS